MDRVKEIQQLLKENNIQGWLFYDFRKNNPLAYKILELPFDAMYTRRWYYFIPQNGNPVAIVSSVESHVLRKLPGETFVFHTWSEMQQFIKNILLNKFTIAMEYSPFNEIPYVSTVDAGTIDFIRSIGIDVISSANLALSFTAKLTPEQIQSHKTAGKLLIEAKDELFAMITNNLNKGINCNEYDIQQKFLSLIDGKGLTTEDESPIVAANGNASNPHYEPTQTRYSEIHRGDLILFDFWAHLKKPDAIWADYTWMAFAGTKEQIPQKQKDVFRIVAKARDTAIDYIQNKLKNNEQIEGREVDDVARKTINEAGYGEYFVHRTGHNIETELHGRGTNIDNYETNDSRIILPYTCNSIEPGIYLPEFGIRSEVDLLILDHDLEVTGVPIQKEITPLL